MEAIARRGKRTPLSDCTNSSLRPSHSSSSSSSSAIVKPKIPFPSSPIPELQNREANSSSSPKTNADDHSSMPNTITSNPSSDLVPSCDSTPSPPTNSSPLTDAAGREVVEPCSVYTRRQPAGKTKSRGKAIAAPATCIPAVKAQFTGDKFSGVSSLYKSSTVPPRKKQRHTKATNYNTEHGLPQDFIEQQRAYFAEVDAFELSEEEVASIDELD